MNRVAATTYLTGMYGTGANNLLALADIPATDTSGGLAQPIDDALLLAGVAYADLASGAPTETLAYRAALRYTTLKRIIAGLNAKSQMGVAQVGQGVSLDVRDWIKRLQGDLLIAAAEARAYGLNISIDGSSGWASLGDITGVPGWSLDYLELVETM